MFIGSAEEVEIDKQNRIKLPQALLLDVGIQKECMIVGVMNHIEIWPLDAWQAYKQRSLTNASSNAAKLGAGGF
jgi:MraZ protein